MTIFFDLDHTLLNLKDADRAALHRYRAVSPLGELLAWEPFYALWEELRIDSFDRYLSGEFTYEQQKTRRMREMYRVAGLNYCDEEAARAFADYLTILREEWKLFPEAREALHRLRAYPLGLITNGNEAQQKDKLRRLGLEGWFDPCVIASEAGCAKPDPRIFLLACERAGEKPEACFYVGDHLEKDILPALAVGMSAVWVDRESLPQDTPPEAVRCRVNNLMEAVDLIEEKLRESLEEGR